jgi:hypothetical protein
LSQTRHTRATKPFQFLGVAPKRRLNQIEKLMFTKPCLILTTLAAMAFTPVAARAQDSDALLDLLVKKKIVTEKEAASLRSDLAKQESAAVTPVTSSATKLKLSTPLTEIELYGDARVRYEVRNGETAAPDSINRPATPTSGIGRVTASASVSRARSWMTGFSACAWRQTVTRAPPISPLAMTPQPAQVLSLRIATRLTLGRLTSATKDSLV